MEQAVGLTHTSMVKAVVKHYGDAATTALSGILMTAARAGGMMWGLNLRCLTGRHATTMKTFALLCAILNAEMATFHQVATYA